MNRSQSTESKVSLRQPDPMDSLNRTIADLEARIERLNTRSRQPPKAQARETDQAGRQSYAKPPHPAASAPAGEARFLSEPRDKHRPEPRSFRHPERDSRAGRDDWYRSAAPAAMRDVVADTRDLSEAMHSLRRNLREDMSETLDQRIGPLRHDIDDVKALHIELEELRAIVRRLPDEQSMRRLEDRWDGFENRLSGFDATALREELVTLSFRLDDIKSSIGQLPSALPLHALEGKIKMLVGAIDAICRQTGSNDPELMHRFAVLDDRLDEISHAIVAAGVSQADDRDSRAIEALEARFDTLLDQLDTIGQALPPFDLVDRLNAMSDRIEELSNEQAYAALIDRFDNLSHTMAEWTPEVDPRLLDQIDRIAQKIDALDIGGARNGLADQIEALSLRIDTIAGDLSAANGNQDMLFDRLEDLAGQVRQVASQTEPADLTHIETGLANIAARLDETLAPQISGDDAIRSLEQQVSDLSRFLSQPSPSADPELVPRLAAIEEQLSASHSDREEMIVEAARKAAEAAVATLQRDNAPVADISAIESLVADLRALEEASRRSDERNARTIDAVHNTMIKIAERLEELERPERMVFPKDRNEPPPFLTEETGFADGEGDLRFGGAYPVFSHADAEADSGDYDDAHLPAGADADVLAEIPERMTGEAGDSPSIDSADQMDFETANRPLEPGSGAPDIASIMAKVREAQRRGLAGDPDGEDGDEMKGSRTDIIAAARRAARAAASEATIEATRDRKSESTGNAKDSKAGSSGKRVRKSILLATGAVLLAILAYPFVTDFLPGRQSPPVASLEKPASPESEVPGTAVVETPETNDSLAATMPGREEDEKVDIPPASTETTGAVRVEKPATPVRKLSPDNSVQPAGSFVAPDPESEAGTAPQPPSAPDLGQIEMPPEAIGPEALRQAAVDGDSLALFEIGARYTDGRGVAVDMAEAAKWYELSAKLGFAPAQYRLANLYEKGNVVERDMEKARTWYQMAAEQGNASAMHNLAVLFAMKKDGVSDFDSAARWFVRAADLGVKDSQFNLAILYARGTGVPQDLVESYKWFAIVAKSGDKDAAKKRDEVGNALSPEQLKEARDRVENWKPAELDSESNAISIPESWTGSESTLNMQKAVRNLQAILTKNGFDTGGVDGIMGGRTITAIKQFQASVGLEPTGEVNDRLVNELLARNS